MDRYAVFGFPVSHSLSPKIHTQFALENKQVLTYEAIEAAPGAFEEALATFAASGGRGANVTVPHKAAAAALAQRCSPAVSLAGAANTLCWADGGWEAHNTDGLGLINDLKVLGWSLEGRRLALVGAGGAAAGVIAPLLAEGPEQLVILNRTEARAEELCDRFKNVSGASKLAAGGLNTRLTFDGVINATAASLSGERPPLPRSLWAPEAFAYDMMYGATATPFLQWAESCGIGARADGFGMLVEQAAEAFALWRGVRPSTEGVRGRLNPVAPTPNDNTP
ncbi:MAG: shikimate dehydrogenase [Gammaproteobacteria bacterium]|nr:shikimate dehydrogenase [Gammaproteobacteria bacterium]